MSDYDEVGDPDALEDTTTGQRNQITIINTEEDLEEASFFQRPAECDYNDSDNETLAEFNVRLWQCSKYKSHHRQACTGCTITIVISFIAASALLYGFVHTGALFDEEKSLAAAIGMFIFYVAAITCLVTLIIFFNYVARQIYILKRNIRTGCGLCCRSSPAAYH